jgi:CBS domain-containing protein
VLAFRTLRTRVHLLSLLTVTPFVACALWQAGIAPGIAVDVAQADRAQGRASALALHADSALRSLDVLLDSGIVALDQSGEVTLATRGAVPVRDAMKNGMVMAFLDTAGNSVATISGEQAIVPGMAAARRRDMVAEALRRARMNDRAQRRSSVDIRPQNAIKDSARLVLVRPLPALPARCDCLRDVDGTLVLALTDAGVRGLLGTDAYTGDSTVSVLDSTGNTIAGREATAWLHSEDIVRTVAGGSSVSDSARASADGAMRFVGYAGLTTRPWQVVVGIPSLVTAAADTRVRDAMVLTVLSLLLAWIGTELVWRRYQQSMLRIITEVMPISSRMAQGRTQVAAPLMEASTAPHVVDLGGAGADRATSAAESDTLAAIAALAELARATVDQPELQLAALARLRELAAGQAHDHDPARAAQAPAQAARHAAPVTTEVAAPLPAMKVRHLRIRRDQRRFDTIPPTSA